MEDIFFGNTFIKMFFGFICGETPLKATFVENHNISDEIGCQRYLRPTVQMQHSTRPSKLICIVQKNLMRHIMAG